MSPGRNSGCVFLVHVQGDRPVFKAILFFLYLEHKLLYVLAQLIKKSKVHCLIKKGLFIPLFTCMRGHAWSWSCMTFIPVSQSRPKTNMAFLFNFFLFPIVILVSVHTDQSRPFRSRILCFYASNVQ